VRNANITGSIKARFNLRAAVEVLERGILD
jgi:hypothetical protein